MHPRKSVTIFEKANVLLVTFMISDLPVLAIAPSQAPFRSIAVTTTQAQGENTHSSGKSKKFFINFVLLSFVTFFSEMAELLKKDEK
jgi:hypothetical protein